MIDTQRLLSNLQLLRFQFEAIVTDVREEKKQISQQRCSMAVKLIAQIEQELRFANSEVKTK